MSAAKRARSAGLQVVESVLDLPGEIEGLAGFTSDVVEELDEISVAVENIEATITNRPAVGKSLARIRKALETARASCIAQVAAGERLAEQARAGRWKDPARVHADAAAKGALR